MDSRAQRYSTGHCEPPKHWMRPASFHVYSDRIRPHGPTGLSVPTSPFRRWPAHHGHSPRTRNQLGLGAGVAGHSVPIASSIGSGPFPSDPSVSKYGRTRSHGSAEAAEVGCWPQVSSPARSEGCQFAPPPEASAISTSKPSSPESRDASWWTPFRWDSYSKSMPVDGRIQ